MVIERADRVCGEDRKVGGENKVEAVCDFGNPYGDSRYRRTLGIQNHEGREDGGGRSGLSYNPDLPEENTVLLMHRRE